MGYSDGKAGQTFQFCQTPTVALFFLITLLIGFNLGLDVLVKSLELVHVRFLGGPSNGHTLLLIGLGDLVYRQHIPISGQTMHELLTKWQMNIPCGSAPVKKQLVS